MTCSSKTENGVRCKVLAVPVGYELFVSRRTEKKEQRRHHQLAQLIKVINTLAILFIVIPELTKFRTIKCFGHLHIVSMPLFQHNDTM